MDSVIQMLENVGTLQEAIDNESDDMSETRLNKIISFLESHENRAERAISACVINRCLNIFLDKAGKSRTGGNLFQGVVTALRVMDKEKMLAESNIGFLGDAVRRLQELKDRYLLPGTRADFEATRVMNSLVTLDPEASAGVKMPASDESVSIREKAQIEDNLFFSVAINQDTSAKKVVSRSEATLNDLLNKSILPKTCQALEAAAERYPEEVVDSVGPTMVELLRCVLLGAEVGPDNAPPPYVASVLHVLAVLASRNVQLVQSCLQGDCLDAVGILLNNGDEKCAKYVSQIVAHHMCHQPTLEMFRSLQSRKMFPHLLSLTMQDGDLNAQLVSDVMRLCLSTTAVEGRSREKLLEQLIIERLSTDIQTIRNRKGRTHERYIECLLDVLRTIMRERDFNRIKKDLVAKVDPVLKDVKFSFNFRNKEMITEVRKVLDQE